MLKGAFVAKKRSTYCKIGTSRQKLLHSDERAACILSADAETQHQASFATRQAGGAAALMASCVYLKRNYAGDTARTTTE